MVYVDRRRRDRWSIIGFLALATALGGAAHAAFITVNGTSGAPGETVEYSVCLTNAEGDAVTALAVDIDSEPGLAARVGNGGRPDCRLGLGIVKPQSTFSFRPPACTPGVSCELVRAAIISLVEPSSGEPLPDGTVYTCMFDIPPNAAIGETYALTIAHASGFDSTGTETDLTEESVGATITVSGRPSPGAIRIGSANLERGGSGSFDVVLVDPFRRVIATENDIVLDLPISIPERMMAATALAAAIDADDDRIAVLDASGLPDLGSVVINDEAILYSAKEGNDLIVARRGDGVTTVGEHGAGAIVEVPTRLPDCAIGSALGASGKSAVFAYVPDGCTPGGKGHDRCQAVRAIVLGIQDFKAIPTGTTLYTCAVTAGPDRGEFPLLCPEGVKIPLPFQPAQASGDPDVDPNPFETRCTDGIARVAGTAEVEIAVGSTVVQPEEQATFGVTLHAPASEVFATLNDVLFEPGAQVESRSATATLAADIDADDLLIEVEDASELPPFGVVQIDDERIAYAGIEGDVITAVGRGFDGTTPAPHQSQAILSVPSALPDCRPGEDLAALGKSAVFSFVPDGCTPSVNCLAVRAVVIGLGSTATIPDGTLLYECTVNGGTSSGTFALTCPEGRGVEPPFQPAQASAAPQTDSLEARCTAGSWAEVIRAARGEAPTSVASLVSAVDDVLNGCTPAEEPVSAPGTTGLPAEFDTICPDGEVQVGATPTPTTPRSPSPTPTRDRTPTPSRTVGSPTPTTPPRTTTPTVPASGCTGDCDESGAVSVDELIRGVGIGLAAVPLDECPPVDANDNDRATVDELVTAVRNAIEGCP